MMGHDTLDHDRTLDRLASSLAQSLAPAMLERFPDYVCVFFDDPEQKRYYETWLGLTPDIVQKHAAWYDRESVAEIYARMLELVSQQHSSNFGHSAFIITEDLAPMLQSQLHKINDHHYVMDCEAFGLSELTDVYLMSR